MATANNDLRVRITAVDNASAAIDAVARHLGGLTAPAQKVGKSLARLSDVTGVTRLSKAIATLSGNTARAGTRMTEALAPLGILTGALSAAGAGKMVSDWARMSQALSFDAVRIGTGISQLHALEGSARLSGSSAQAASSGLRTLQDTMTDTVGGRNMQALLYFKQLGVAFDDGAGHALRASDVLPKLADRLKLIGDRSIRARVGTALLGGAYEELAPWIDQGSKGMADYADLARRYGVQTEESARAAGVFRFAQERLTLAFQGLGNSISEKVSPPLSKMMTFLAELVGRNRDLISDKFGQWAKQLADWVQSIDWGTVTTKFGELFDRFERWTDAMSKWHPPAWMKLAFGFSDGTAPGVDMTSDGKIVMPRPGGVEADSPPLTPGQHTDVGKLMMGMFEGGGWSHDDAAAILSGLDRESGLRKDAVGDSGLAYGAAQWHPNRQAQFDAWSKAGGTNDGRDIRHSSIEDQTKFIQWDLTQGKYKSVGDHMRAAQTLDEKVGIFDREYEAPADIDGAIRSDIPRAQAWARQTPTGERFRNAQEDAHLGPAPEEPMAIPGSNGKVQVDVNIRGLPPGSSATATTSGAAQAGVKVARAMPQ